MDLISVDPQLNLYDTQWPIRSFQPQLPPPKFVFSGGAGDNERRGYAMDSIVCQGSIVSGGQVEKSILSPNVRVNSFAQVEGSILFEGVDIGRHCKVRRAIIDKNVSVPAGLQIGYDPDEGRANGFSVSDTGIVVIARADGADLLESVPQLT